VDFALDSRVVPATILKLGALAGFPAVVPPLLHGVASWRGQRGRSSWTDDDSIRGRVRWWLAGAASRVALRQAEADGNLGDHCNKDNPCKKPLVCINTECDHCRTSGDCHQGWCCEGYTCNTSNQCVACGGNDRALGVEGCRRKKKKKRKKKH
jgi:hypothetical protein